MRIAETSELMQKFRGRLFSRIVPTVKDIGLWGPKVQKAFTDMGVMDLAGSDAEEMLESDNRVADDFDRLRSGELALAEVAGRA